MVKELILILYFKDLEGLETLTTASPSRALNRQSLLVRQSKGNPLYAKPVGIPIVPTLQPKLNSGNFFQSI